MAKKNSTAKPPRWPRWKTRKQRLALERVRWAKEHAAAGRYKEAIEHYEHACTLWPQRGRTEWAPRIAELRITAAREAEVQPAGQETHNEVPQRPASLDEAAPALAVPDRPTAGVPAAKDAAEGLGECRAAVQHAAMNIEMQVERLAGVEAALGNSANARLYEAYLRVLRAARERAPDRDPVASTSREKAEHDLVDAAELLERGGAPDRRAVSNQLIDKCIELLQGRRDTETLAWLTRPRGWLCAAAWLAATLPDYLPQAFNEPSTGNRAFVDALQRLRLGIVPVLTKQGLDERNLLSDLLGCDEQAVLTLSNAFPIRRGERELEPKEVAEKLFKEIAVALGRPDVRKNWLP